MSKFAPWGGALDEVKHDASTGQFSGGGGAKLTHERKAAHHKERAEVHASGGAQMNVGASKAHAAASQAHRRAAVAHGAGHANRFDLSLRANNASKAASNRTIYG